MKQLPLSLFLPGCWGDVPQVVGRRQTFPVGYLRQVCCYQHSSLLLHERPVEPLCHLIVLGCTGRCPLVDGASSRIEFLELLVDILASLVRLHLLHPQPDLIFKLPEHCLGFCSNIALLLEESNL
jgi:hypothetical protein